MGGGDRRCRAHPRDRLARLSCGPAGPPRPCRDRPARGHAGGARQRERRRSRGACAHLAWPDPDGRLAEAALGRQTAHRHCGRQRLEREGGRLPAPLRRAFRSAGRHLLAPRHALSRRSPQLCGRTRHRAKPETARPHRDLRSRAADRRAHGGDSLAGLHALRHPHAPPESGACAWGRAGAGPGLSSAPGHQRHAPRLRRRAGESATAEYDSLGFADGAGQRGFPWLDRRCADHARQDAAGRNGPMAARASAPRRHRDKWRGQLRDLGGALHALSSICHTARPGVGLHGLWPARRRGRQARASRTHGRLLCGRRLLFDERAGIRHRRAI